MKYTGRQKNLLILLRPGLARSARLVGLIGSVLLFGGVYFSFVTASGSSTGEARPLLTAPTFTQVKQLNATNGELSDHFGISVAISGDTAVVGALEAAGPNGTDLGTIYIYERNQGGSNNWGEVKRIQASDGEWLDRFGQAVAIFNNTVVVGALLDDIGSNTDQGSAYVFERNQGGSNNWGLVKKLTAMDGAAHDEFGVSVAVSNETILIGAHLNNTGANNDQGAAYIYGRDQGGAGNWGQVKKLTASDGADNDDFGWAAALKDDTAVISADKDTIGTNNGQGSVYIFKRDQGGADNWGQVKKIIAFDGAPNDLFGYSAAIEGDTVIIGCLNDGIGSNALQGSGYVYERNRDGAENWGLTKKLVSSDGHSGDGMGRSVAISNNVVVLGATGVDIGSAMQRGAAYTFGKDDGGTDNWGQAQKILSNDGAAGDTFGNYVAISNNSVIIGARFDDAPNNPAEGSAYIFSAVPPTAALVTVSGRVMTSGGTGVNNALVRITDHNGVTRESRTNVFGYYVFEEVEAGQVYVFNVISKAYQFEPRVVTVGDTINDLNFTAGQ
jgi:hypothetical protein